MAQKRKFYVVWEGREIGVFRSWLDCEAQIKNFPKAKYKSFESEEPRPSSEVKKSVFFICSIE